MDFTDGSSNHCPNEKPRESTIHFSCGRSTDITQVNEVSACKYAIQFSLQCTLAFSRARETTSAAPMTHATQIDVFEGNFWGDYGQQDYYPYVTE